MGVEARAAGQSNPAGAGARLSQLRTVRAGLSGGNSHSISFFFISIRKCDLLPSRTIGVRGAPDCQDRPIEAGAADLS